MARSDSVWKQSGVEQPQTFLREAVLAALFHTGLHLQFLHQPKTNLITRENLPEYDFTPTKQVGFEKHPHSAE